MNILHLGTQLWELKKNEKEAIQKKIQIHIQRDFFLLFWDILRMLFFVRMCYNFC